MVFLIQSTQNRDTKLIQIKIDELIRAVDTARNQLLNLENLTDKDLTRLRKEFEQTCTNQQGKATRAALVPTGSKPGRING